MKASTHTGGCYILRTGGGFRYAANEGTAGLVRVRLAAGRSGSAKVAAKVRGSTRVPLTALPLGVPVTVQLQGAGECWGARFSSRGVRRNRASVFEGRSDRPVR